MVPGQNVHDADQKECEAETVRSIAVHCHDSVSQCSAPGKRHSLLTPEDLASL